jgi:GT2 family glycosyltransferase
MINICVPVLNRYDLLREMVRSCHAGNIRPDTYYIIDNGRSGPKLMESLKDFAIHAKVHTPKQSLGVAASWNWFIQQVPEERVIVNDDVLFGPTSLEVLLASKADLVWAEGCGFSCYVIRDRCVEKIGLFDEDISPGYGYYEDEDYLQRLDGRGTRAPSAVAEEVSCDIAHLKSATLKAKSHEEILEHHRKFKLAQANYAKKWSLEEAFK